MNFVPNAFGGPTPTFDWTYGPEPDRRTDSERVSDAIGYVLMVADHMAGLHRRHPNTEIPEDILGRAEKRRQDAEATLIRALEDIGITGDDIPKLRDALSRCDLWEPEA